MATTTDNNTLGLDVNANLTPGFVLGNIAKATAAFGNRYAPTTGNLVQIIDPAVNTKGGRLTSAGAIALDTATDTEVALFAGTSLANAKYIGSAKITGASIVNTGKNAQSCDFGYAEGGPAFQLPLGWGVWGGIAVAQTNGVNIWAFGGGYTGV